MVHASAVRSSRYEALGKFGEHSSCSRLRLEQLLRIFRALQTSRVLHIIGTMHERTVAHEPIVKCVIDITCK